MGIKKAWRYSSSSGTKEATRAMGNFNVAEIQVLRKTFQHLATRSKIDAIDKTHFLQYLPFPGLLGERVFAKFDKDGNNKISYDEFMSGLAVLCRGKRIERMNFLFSLYDLSGSGSISREELTIMLKHFPYSAFQDKAPSESSDSILPEINRDSVEVTVDDLVDDAFCHPFRIEEENLSVEAFGRWCERVPGITEYVLDFMPFGPLKEDLTATALESMHKFNITGATKRRSSHEAIARGGNAPLPQDSKEMMLKQNQKTRKLLIDAYTSCSLATVRLAIDDAIRQLDDAMLSKERSGHEYTKSGYLWKIGKRLGGWKKRYFFVRGNFLYYFLSPTTMAPCGVIMLTGCSIEIVDAENNFDHRAYFGFSIKVGGEERIFYARSELERNKWIASLRQGSCKAPIEESYKFGNEIGKGRFSVVYTATHRISSEEVAIKVIGKDQLGSTEKEMLRTEIAILKLVRHPNIIQLKDVFETHEKIYIVTERLHGGELYKHIVHRYNEEEVSEIMRPLLHSVAYLHDLGIVHRDIKAENILMGHSFSDVRIADFGLSRLLLPAEFMKMPCGTLNYVAPEVLTLQGYGKAADLWSLGVLMFFLLSGQLPFSGKNKNDIIDRTLHETVHLKTQEWERMSLDCISLLETLLVKDPLFRITAREALNSTWFLKKSEGSSKEGILDVVERSLE